MKLFIHKSNDRLINNLSFNINLRCLDEIVKSYIFYKNKLVILNRYRTI